MIDGLVGTAVFESLRTIRRQQQQWLAGPVRFHGGGKQVGNGRPRRGDHRCWGAGSRRQTQGKKSGGAFINRRVQPDRVLLSETTRSNGQRSRTTAGAQHKLLKPLADQRLQQNERGLEIGAGGWQSEASGWGDLRSAMPPSSNATQKPGQNSGPDWGFWRSLLLWALAALLLRWAVIEPRWIPSGSMLPTLQLQDKILVEKIQPRLNHQLHLGDVVVFRPPDNLTAAGYDPQAALIKRVVGQAGDSIAVADGRLIRNGIAVEEPWIAESIGYAMDPVTVPEHMLWVMGDNRNASLDSHLWGALPEDNVIGTAIWRYWPLNQFGSLRISETTKQG